MSSCKIYKTKEEILSLFQELGVSYIIKPELSIPLPAVSPENTEYYCDNKEEFRLLNERYGDLIRKGDMGHVYVKKINEHMGYGLFASRDLPEGTFVGEYTGIVRIASHCSMEDDNKEYETDYAWDYPDLEDHGRELEIDARNKGKETRFINHDFQPNVDIDHTVVDDLWRLFFVTNRIVKKDSQILASYGEDYWVGGFREIMV